MTRKIDTIIVHCSATRASQMIGAATLIVWLVQIAFDVDVSPGVEGALATFLMAGAAYFAKERVA